MRQLKYDEVTGMWFRRMLLEEWFDKYQYEIRYNVGESAVHCLTFADIDIDLRHVSLRYGYHAGKPELREVIADQYEGLSSEHVVVTNGGSEALFSVAACLLKPGDHVIVEHPNYPSNYEVLRSLGCKVDLLHLEFENDFQLDLNELKALMTPQTKLVCLTHPNNPTGSMISEKTLEETVDLIESRGCFMVFDETYRELAFGHKLPTAASASSKAVSISTMSKSYGLPGIRIGWIATKDKFILESVLAIREQVTICNSAISEVIALSVLERKDEFLENVRRHVERNSQTVVSWMENQKELEWKRPEAGVICFPRIKLDVFLNPENLYQLLVEKYKTFVIPGRCFEMDNRHFRLGYGGMPRELEVGLKNIGKALKEVVDSTSF
ncbi:MAG: aminotransferase class I/II-fold pyridoxal phosphate-dependent enzyme [Candidatus Thorarchaeota archaeon]